MGAFHDRSKQNACKKVSSGLHYGAQMEVKIAKKILNALLEVSQRGLFAKTADLHQTLLLVIQTHVRPPWRAPFFFLLGPKVTQKTFRRGIAKCLTKKHHKVTKNTPKLTPKWSPRPRQISVICPWQACLRANMSNARSKSAF